MKRARGTDGLDHFEELQSRSAPQNHQIQPADSSVPEEEIYEPAIKNVTSTIEPDSIPAEALKADIDRVQC
ncbi:hypothetical protein ACOMHN_059009 [Nucella lapillus]